MPKQTFLNLDKKKQNRIIDNTIDALSEKGYSALTIQDLIKAFGIPRGSFYQYFESKGDLVTYILFNEHSKLELVEQKLFKTRDNLTFLDYTREEFKMLLEHYSREPKLVNVIAELFDSKEFREENSEILRTHNMQKGVSRSELYIEFIKERYTSKELRQDVELKAQIDLLLGLKIVINKKLIKVIKEKEIHDMERLFEEYLKVIKSGFLNNQNEEKNERSN